MLVEIDHLRVEKAGQPILAVKRLAFEQSARVAIQGPNGSGKTTLLRVLGGLEKEYSGQCKIRIPQTECVFVHQAPYLFKGSVLFNTTYGLAGRRIGRVERKRIAGEWLACLGVEHLIDRDSASLSGGERRRIALARAFALQPSLLLLDEPFADLDEKGIQFVLRAFTRLDHTTVVISSPTLLPEPAYGTENWRTERLTDVTPESAAVDD